LRALQTQTFSQALELCYEGGCELVLDYHVGESDILRVAAEEEDGYSLWFDRRLGEDSLCEVIIGKYPWQRIIRFDKERFGVLPRPGQRMLVTVTSPEFDEILGRSTGFANERMEARPDNLYELRLATVEEKNGRPFYRLWSECESLSEAGVTDRLFELDRPGGAVTFGDGLRGEQPGPGKLILAVTAKTSLLDSGNVLARRVNRFADENGGGIRATNPEEASGGRRAKTSAELESELEGLLMMTTRAVTAADYEELIRATPGLIIDMVNVFGGAQYAAAYGGSVSPGAVMAAVKSHCGKDPRPSLSEGYRLRIRENLEKYRLLTTDIRILPAKYVGVEADGRIMLTENTPDIRRRVEEALAELIAPPSANRFGASIMYGRIFSRLEMLDCVARVGELSFSCTGEGGYKNEQGDIVIYPDAIAWLTKINIEFA
ncbi:MAG: hypothetical protein LBU86_00780, partial [Oscillospiraceae bacterium]|nr:hypothetical protein [Oscillospiraceae bacterium]